jgi:hypothetical protein
MFQALRDRSLSVSSKSLKQGFKSRLLSLEQRGKERREGREKSAAPGWGRGERGEDLESTAEPEAPQAGAGRS